MAKDDLPPQVRNKLMRWPEPMIADLQGPGPFQLPLLSSTVSATGLDMGGLEIRLETELGQEVRLRLTENAWSMLSTILKANETILMHDADGKRN
jgi:hypothetical protein